VKAKVLRKCSEQQFLGAEDLDWQVCRDASSVQHSKPVNFISLHMQSWRSFCLWQHIILGHPFPQPCLRQRACTF